MGRKAEGSRKELPAFFSPKFPREKLEFDFFVTSVYGKKNFAEGVRPKLPAAYPA